MDSSLGMPGTCMCVLVVKRRCEYKATLQRLVYAYFATFTVGCQAVGCQIDTHLGTWQCGVWLCDVPGLLLPGSAVAVQVGQQPGHAWHLHVCAG